VEHQGAFGTAPDLVEIKKEQPKTLWYPQMENKKRTVIEATAITR